MRLPAATTLLMLLVGAGLLAWNGSRFVGAQPKIRTKDLDFLPSPEVARAFSLGHHNTLAKLRWIDSFAYFELQLERKDDTVSSTGESAFERLYRMLVGLDPRFLPFYEHASLNLGGVLNRHEAVLSLLSGGLLTLPHERQLWRMIATELQVNFKLEERNAPAMDTFLATWADTENDEGRQEVWDWKKAMARRQYRDMAQMPYWEEQLRLAKPGTQMYDFIIETMREQLARYGVERLTAALAAWKRQHPIPATALEEVLDPAVVRSVFPDGIPAYAPIYLENGVPRLRADPFGYPYALVDGRPVSPGWEALIARNQAGPASQRLESIAIRTGAWPTTLDKAVAAGVQLGGLPPHCHWSLSGKAIVVEVDPPPFPDWNPSTQ